MSFTVKVLFRFMMQEEEEEWGHAAAGLPLACWRASRSQSPWPCARAVACPLFSCVSGRVGRRTWSNFLRLNGRLDSPRTFCRHRDSPYSMHLHGLYSSKLKRP